MTTLLLLLFAVITVISLPAVYAYRLDHTPTFSKQTLRGPHQ